MQRIIKYRCYHKRDEKYILLTGICFETNEVVVYQEKNFVDNGGNCIIPMDDVILEQFTGLTDKNGKEVHEGDIIKSPLGNIVKVIWGTHTISTRTDDYECYGWLVCSKKLQIDFLDSSITNGEIIGNIHDNPELLNNRENKERTTSLGTKQDPQF